MKIKILTVTFLSLLVLIYCIFLILKSNTIEFENKINSKIEQKIFILDKYINNSQSLLNTLNDSFLENLEIFEKKRVCTSTYRLSLYQK